MTINVKVKLYVGLPLLIAALTFAAGASGHEVVGKPRVRSTDDDFERSLASIMKRDAGQRRASLTYNSILARVARQRAYDMGRRNYFDHVNPDGIGPNYLVTQAGYVLPDFYGKGRAANNIESISARRPTPEAAWNSWMNSTGHRTHLLGLTDFYAEQVEYGVGHAFVPGSRYEHYWVVITAKPGGGGGASASGSEDVPDHRRRGGSPSAYPNVIRGAGGQLWPASGYVWVNDDDPTDFRVRLMPGLIRTEDGKLRPARGYTWVNPDDPRDLRVRPVP